MHEFALFAGSAAAAIFMISQLPMLIKAYRTKDLTSYSFANMGLANLGNVLYAVYVLQVPVGPVWAIHGFNVTTSGLMMILYLRYGRRVDRSRSISSATPSARLVLARQLSTVSAAVQSAVMWRTSPRR